jgi:DNA-binding transcriptional ArsR family regulator
MNPKQIVELDPIVHAPLRLAILSILVTVEEANFAYLKEATDSSDGNLSTHLSKLEASGYITLKKSFVAKKPQTMCSITRKGKQALLKHLDRLEQIIAMQKREKGM